MIYSVGHSGTVVSIEAGWRVLEVGSGDAPNPRSNVLVDRYTQRSEHRSGNLIVRDGRPLIIADACALPFADQAFDFVIASHIAEHVDTPQEFCRELMRVATRGYIETPGFLTDVLLGEPFHKWSVRVKNGALSFRPLIMPTGRVVNEFSNTLYSVFYFGDSRSRRTSSPASVNSRLLRSLFWRGKGFLWRAWSSRIMRPLTYTCFYFERAFGVKVETSDSSISKS